MTGNGQRDDAVWRLPLYSKAEAAKILRLSPSTLNNWVSGYSYPTRSGERQQKPLVTRTAPIARKTVPFAGIAEAYVLSALKRAGVPMQRIRPAVAQLEAEFGLEHALLSERLKTDGVDVLFDYLVKTDPGFVPVSVLTAVRGRDRQMVFRESVESYLKTISYGNHAVDYIQLPFYRFPVVINPRVNAGRPTTMSRGVRVRDIVDRVKAGDSIPEVADDYDFSLESVILLLADAS
jgi:uncharacterized protein (DUF433 family)